jgi:hypothetical protein
VVRPPLPAITGMASEHIARSASTSPDTSRHARRCLHAGRHQLALLVSAQVAVNADGGKNGCDAGFHGPPLCGRSRASRAPVK